jgi:hypothetical protein
VQALETTKNRIEVLRARMWRRVRKGLDVREAFRLARYMEKCSNLEQLIAKSPREFHREAEGHLRMNGGDF